MTKKPMYHVARVSAGEYQVIHNSSNSEYCLCCEFEGEESLPRERAERIANTLNQIFDIGPKVTADEMVEVNTRIGCDDATAMLNWLDSHRSYIGEPLATNIIEYISATQLLKHELSQLLAR